VTHRTSDGNRLRHPADAALVGERTPADVEPSSRVRNLTDNSVEFITAATDEETASPAGVEEAEAATDANPDSSAHDRPDDDSDHLGPSSPKRQRMSPEAKVSPSSINAEVHNDTDEHEEEIESADSEIQDDRCKRCGIDDMEPHMICDGCDGVHHFKCFGIKAMVEGDWYCEECRPRTTHPSVACAIPPPSPATKAAVVAEPVPAAVKNSRASKVVGPTPSPPPPPRLPRPVDPALSTQDLVPNETPAHDRSRSSSSPKGKRKKGTVDATRGKLSHKTLQRHKALHANVVHDLATRGRKSEQFALMRVGAEVFICKNERVGHHDVTGKKAHVQNKRAVIMAEAVWPSTWLSVKVVETGEVVKVRTSNVILAMDAEHSV